MKKLVVIISFSCLAISCDDQKDTKQPAEDSTASAATTTNDPEATKGLDLVAKSDCFTCHKVGEKFVGPAYVAVAERYKPTDEVIDTLSQKIIQGGSGRWGEVPMTAHPLVSKDDAKTMVKYILSLKK